MNPEHPVIIDTSVWIEFFNRLDSPEGHTVETLIDAQAAVIVGPVLFELLQGAKTLKECELLKEVLQALPHIVTGHSLWEAAGTLSFDLRRKGITIPMTDCLIAATARHHCCRVFTLDHHFQHFPDILFTR